MIGLMWQSCTYSRARTGVSDRAHAAVTYVFEIIIIYTFQSSWWCAWPDVEVIYIHIIEGSERRIWCSIWASICRKSRIMYKCVCRKSPASYPSYASLFRVLHNACMSHTNEWGHVWMSCVTYLRAHMADSLVCYISLRHVAHNRPHTTLTNEWVMSLMKESCRIRMSRTRNEMCNMTGSSVTWLINVWDSQMTWLIHRCNMTHSRITAVTWLIHVWHESFMCHMTC